MSFLAQLNWRYATKKFDISKPVSPTQLTNILEAIRLAPTSLGLQPFHVTVVTNPDIKSKLQEKGYNQAQFTTASHVLVFSSRNDILPRANGMFDTFINAGAPAESLEGYRGMVNGLDAQLANDINRSNWAARQAYIALGFGLAAAAELNVDSCPMEGFDRDAFKDILKLPATHSPVAVLALGTRDASDVIRPKFRFPDTDIFNLVA